MRVFTVYSRQTLCLASLCSYFVWNSTAHLSKIPDVRVPFLGQNLAPVPVVKDLGIFTYHTRLEPYI